MTGKYFDYIVTILMENNGLSDIIPSATFMTKLANQNCLLTGYSGVDHPSEGNYVVMIAGDDYGFTNDCGNCPGRTSAKNIIDSLETAGLTWKAMAEGASNSKLPSFSPPRGGDHFAFITFSDNITTARAVNFISVNTSTQAELINELNSPNASNFIWFTPTDNHNMHDNSVSSGDSYIATLVPKILASSTFMTKRAVLVIVFDEGNGSFPNDFIYFAAVGPVAKKTFTSSASYSHYSYLRTIEDNWGLPILANEGQGAIMSELFGTSTPPPPTVTYTLQAPPGITILSNSTLSACQAVINTLPALTSWVIIDSNGVTINSGITSPAPPPTLNSWHPSITETPQLLTIAQMLAEPITFTTPNKRALPPSVINPIQAGPGAGVTSVPDGFFFEIDNITVQGVNPSGDGEAFTYNGVGYDDTDIDVIDASLPAGQLQGIHCQADMNWKLNGLTSMTDYPTAGSKISIQGYSYYDPSHTSTSLGNGRELHAITAWKDSAGTIHMVGTGITPPPPSPTGLAPFIPSDWSAGSNVGGSPTIGSVSIDSNGVLHTQESTSGGSDNSYGYATAQRGSFPWAPNTIAGTALPSGITRVQTQANILTKSFLAGHSRQHTYVGLYYRCAAAINGWFDTQVRIETIDGTDSPDGKTETYLPGDSSGFDVVQTSPDFDIDTELLFQRACNAYGIDPSTSHELAGFEVGTEGFLIQQLDVDWPGINILTGATPPPPPPPGVTYRLEAPPGMIIINNATLAACQAAISTLPSSISWQILDSNNILINSGTTPPTPPSPLPTTGVTLTFEGFDFDGQNEVTLRLNGVIIARYWPADNPVNAQVWTPITENIVLASGLNTLKFTHANFDCTVDDTIRNLQVIDNDNGSVIFSDPIERPLNCTTSVTYTFNNGPPVPPSPLIITFTSTEKLTVIFKASASGGTIPYTYSWDFGDFTTGTGAVITHTYANTGTYNIVLTVSDTARQTVISTHSLSV